jgi:hypothetical protein
MANIQTEISAQINMCKLVIFRVLTTAIIKMTAFWDVAQCSLIEVYRRFVAMKMEAVCTFET